MVLQKFLELMNSGAEVVAGCYRIVHFGHVDVNDVSQLLLCVVRYADEAELAFHADVLVRFGVVQSF